MIREWIRHECVFSTRDANSVKIAQLKRRTTPALLFKHYIFISEDLRRAETLIFLITKVNSISFMCFVSQSLSSAAAVCLCLQTGTLGLSPHAILAVLFQEKKKIVYQVRSQLRLSTEDFFSFSRSCIEKDAM